MVGYECIYQSGFHLKETELILEVLKPGTSTPVDEGEVGELVATSIVRTGTPIIRYRINDLVRITRKPCDCGRTTAQLEGGVLGRADGMIVIRGINVYPSAVEDFLMSYEEVVEYCVEIFDRKNMKEVRIKLEVVESDQAGRDGNRLAARIIQDFRQRFFLRVDVEIVPTKSLPRLDGKAKRFVHI